MLTGFKTFATGLGLAVLPQVVSFATNFDFVKTFGLSPDAATVIGLVMIGLRAATSTPIFKTS
jgi:hypothetical protein